MHLDEADHAQSADTADQDVDEEDADESVVSGGGPTAPAPKAADIEGPKGDPAVQVVTNAQPESTPAVGSPFDKAYNIASSGFTSIGNKLTSGSISGGALVTAAAFFQKNWVLLIFATILIILGFALFMLIYHTKHKEKQEEARILSDPNKFNVTFEKR
jgi:hypothetical protein